MKQASSPLQNKIGFGGGGLEYRAAPSPWVPLGTRKLESARQHATTALPRGAACPRWAGDAAHRWGLTGEKTGFVRALAEIDQTTKSCLIDFLLQQSRAVA